MNNILLSICISSYNHGDKCVQLVKRIQSIQDERYNIFVQDDGSDDETQKQLNLLAGSGVTVIRNKTNIGPCKNWFKTISSGTGKYILHVLDRDTIAVNYLRMILDILEKNNVGGGYIGKSKMYPIEELDRKVGYVICNKGREAFLTMAGVPIHPTGFLVQRQAWINGDFKKFFYKQEKYGIYPHSYVLGELSVECDMMFSPIRFCSYKYRGSNRVSRFYEKNHNKEYWWLPDSVIKTDNQLMLYLSKIADCSYKEEFICRRFKMALDRATFGFKKAMANKEEMEHYGFKATYISGWKLLQISIKYRQVFTHLLKKMDVAEGRSCKRLDDIWMDNLKSIFRDIHENSVDRMLEQWNEKSLQFQVMCQWVKAKQEKDNLSTYFKTRNYKRVAIYGMSEIGEMLIDELRDTDIEVVYGIDKNANNAYSNIKVFSIQEELPQVDVVVVIIINEFDQIYQELSRRLTCDIISLLDIVYDI